MRSLYAVALAALLFAPLAHAQVPATLAESNVTARGPGETVGPIIDNDPVMSSATATASTTDFAEARSESNLSGALRSSAVTSGAAGQGELDASSVSRWTQQYTTSGTDPLAPIDLDFDFDVTGTLTYNNNNAGPGLDEIMSFATVVLTVHEIGGETFVFDGTLELSTIDNVTPPNFDRQDDYADAARDGDFTIPFCTETSCQVDVVTAIDFADAALVTFGEVFSVELYLETSGFAFDGAETGASADFFNTATAVPTTSTAGVTLVPIAATVVTPVPALPGVALLLLALLLPAACVLAAARRLPLD